jgi:microcystin degradation protein MlrC
MAVVYDFHGAVSPLIIEKCDIVLGYDTYPHTDWYERGFEAALIMNRAMKKAIRPVSELRKPKIIANLPGQYTGRHPMATAIMMAHEIEKQEKVISATVNGGFPYLDSPNTGLSIVVTTDNDERLAAEKANQLDEFCWKERWGFVRKCTPIGEAVEEALRPEQEYRTGPVVLADEGDSVGSHSPGDGTSIHRALLEKRARNAAIAYWSAKSAIEAMKAGVGNTVTMHIGGQVDEGLDITGTVKVLTDGAFESPVLRGRVDLHSFAMGKTATLKCDGFDIVFTSQICQFNFLYDWRNVGIEPTAKKILVIKSPVHYREHFEPIASKIIEVDTPGLSNPNLDQIPYKNVRRPMVPLQKL